MFEAATAAFKPGGVTGTATPDSSKDGEIAALKAELHALQDKIEKLAK